MTVCVGAICEDSKTVVVAADKMVTFGPPMSLQIEPDTFRKIWEVNNQSVILFAGNVPDGEEIVSTVLNECARDKKYPIKTIGEKVKTAYIALKRKRVEEQFLRPMLGADFGQFQTMVTQSSSSLLLQQVLGMISQHNLQTEVLVAGVDDSGAHLFTVAHPGQLLPADTMGYLTTGSGGLHAAVRLSLAQHSKVAPLVDTVYNVYEAKKAAEVAPGVGKLTDLAVIKAGRVIFAQKDVFDALEKAHKEKPAPTKDEQDELKRVCDAWIDVAAKPK
jgi:20S proteasome alpha/beta subunit